MRVFLAYALAPGFVAREGVVVGVCRGNGLDGWLSLGVWYVKRDIWGMYVCTGKRGDWFEMKGK